MHLPQLLLVPFVKEDEGMEVSISRMKDIRNCKTILFAPLHHPDQHLREFGPRYSSITDKIIGTESRNGAERTLPASPELCSFGLCLRRFYLTGVILPADLHDSFCQSLHPIFEPVELDEKNGLRIERKTRTNRFLNRFNRHFIENFKRSRLDAIGNDGGDRSARILQGIIDGQHVFTASDFGMIRRV